MKHFSLLNARRIKTNSYDALLNDTYCEEMSESLIEEKIQMCLMCITYVKTSSLIEIVGQ